MILLFWLTVWYGLALWVDNSILVATPMKTGERLLTLFGEKNFYLDVASSLARIGAGFLAGFVMGVLLAAGSSRFPVLEEVLSPVMSLMKAVPVASFVVLLLIWWGSSFLAAAICFLVVLPQIYISALEGLKSTNDQLLEMAKVFRLPFWNRFFYIYRPALRPFLQSSLKISLGMCWKSGVAAEVIGIPDYSIGERLYLSKVYLDTAGVFALTAVVVLLSFFFEKTILWLAERFFVWEPACRRQLEPRNAREKQIEQEVGRKDVRGAADPAWGPSVQNRLDGDIRLIGLTKRYGSQVILDGLDAVYRSGESYCLTSPSGSGKTTLLRILAGLTDSDGGEAEVPASCSMVFQEDRLCEEVSAVKNVELVIGDKVRAREALGQLLAAEALDKPCSQLSGGMRRRVALVRAMEADSDFVLLDEPFTGMDAETRHLVQAYIRSRQKGRTLLIATHI